MGDSYEDLLLLHSGCPVDRKIYERRKAERRAREAQRREVSRAMQWNDWFARRFIAELACPGGLYIEATGQVIGETQRDMRREFKAADEEMRAALEAKIDALERKVEALSSGQRTAYKFKFAAETRQRNEAEALASFLPGTARH